MKTIKLWWKLTKIMFLHPRSIFKSVLTWSNGTIPTFVDIESIEYLPSDEYTENRYNVDMCYEGESWYAHHILLEI